MAGEFDINRALMGNMDEETPEEKQARQLQELAAQASAGESEIEEVNTVAKSPNLKTREELEEDKPGPKVDPLLTKLKANIAEYKKRLDAPVKSDWKESLPDILAGAHNILNYSQGSQQKMMDLGYKDKQDTKRAASKKNNLSGLQKLQKMQEDLYKLQNKKDPAAKEGKIFQTRSGLVQIQQGKPVSIYKDDYMTQTGEIRKDSLNLRQDKFKNQKIQKSQEDASKAISSLRATDTWKSSEKAISNIPEIEVLLDDAYKNGGQSLAMLGPRVAKGIAGEVGVLTEQDVTRYVKNPALVGGMLDTLKKLKSGKITDDSYENLKRLLQISKKTATEKMNSAIDREAILLSRREKIPFEEAKYLLDSAYKVSPQEKSSSEKEEPKAPYGDTVERNGKKYRWNGTAGKYQLDK